MINIIECVRENARFINSGYTCCDTLKRNDTALRVQCYNMYASYNMRGSIRHNIYDDVFWIK